MILRQRLPLGLAFLAVALVSGPASDGADSLKDVRVVNTPAEPVPVSATGTVGLVPGSQVGISGAVSLALGTRVDVSNTPDTPLHVAAPAEHRDVFVRTVNLDWLEGASNAFAGIEVPAGKRLIIEYIGGRVSTGEGATMDFTISTSANGGGATFHYPHPADAAPPAARSSPMTTGSRRPSVSTTTAVGPG